MMIKMRTAWSNSMSVSAYWWLCGAPSPPVSGKFGRDSSSSARKFSLDRSLEPALAAKGPIRSETKQ